MSLPARTIRWPLNLQSSGPRLSSVSPDTEIHASFDGVPRKIGSDWVHLQGYLWDFDIDVDSDGTPSSDLEGERVYGQAITELSQHILGGKREIFGGEAVDGRVLRFLAGMREGVTNYGLDDPSDNGADSEADIFGGTTQLMYMFSRAPGDLKGGERDGCIPMVFVDESDELIWKVPGDGAGPLGAESGVDLQDPVLNHLRLYALLRLEPRPIIGPEHRIRYRQQSSTAHRIDPILPERRRRVAEYVGLRQREEDTEALTWANSGNWTVLFPRLGNFSLYGRELSAGDVKEAWTPAERLNARSIGRSQASGVGGQDMAVVDGHMPFIWAGGGAKRADYGRTPVHWSTTSLGQSRDTGDGQPRELTSEYYSHDEANVREMEKRLGLSAGRLDELIDTVRVTSLDASLIPRLVDVPAQIG